jgi:hypothetical protein
MPSDLGFATMRVRAIFVSSALSSRPLRLKAFALTAENAEAFADNADRQKLRESSIPSNPNPALPI